MTHAIPCQQFTRWERPRLREMLDIRVDQLSVDICLGCTEEECDGAPMAHAGRPKLKDGCPYEQAYFERRNRQRARRVRRERVI